MLNSVKPMKSLHNTCRLSIVSLHNGKFHNQDGPDSSDALLGLKEVSYVNFIRAKDV